MSKGGGLRASKTLRIGPVKTLAPNVTDFIATASRWIGRVEDESFNQQAFCRLTEGPIDSPIEQMFYVACRAICHAHRHPFNPDPDFDNGQVIVSKGVYVVPQMQVGRYRVDFGLSEESYRHNETRVIVELDGHAFHDKDKKQRAYEKARDRFLVKEGFRVLHYTGSEVFADPFAVAHEALATLGVMYGEYDAEDPLGYGL